MFSHTKVVDVCIVILYSSNNSEWSNCSVQGRHVGVIYSCVLRARIGAWELEHENVLDIGNSKTSETARASTDEHQMHA